tara:strand:+ start:5779 stop:7506 length:1728 start_codon:yes stop_codon:yes gene_type:complete
MSFLSSLLIKTITKVIKNLTKFEVAIDALIDRFKASCPPKEELLNIVKQKNQIQGALENVVGAFNTVESTAETTNTIVTTVSTAVKVIKAIPIPTSVPPGVGIPINVITLLADSLDTLGDLLKGAKGALKVVPSASKTIQDAAQTIVTKLQTLDGVLNVCIEELAQNGGEDGGPMTQQEINNLINEIGNVAAESGNFTLPGLNVANEDDLLSQLSPNSSDPFLYQRQPTIFVPLDPDGNYTKGEIDPGSGQQIIKDESGRFGYYAGFDWRLTIEYNDDNEFSFPQRRVKATNINPSNFNIFKGINVYNIGPPIGTMEERGAYSYSTSVKVLIDEVKFNVDSLNVRWWSNKWLLDNMEGVNDDDRIGGDGNESGSGGEGNTSAPGGTNPPPPPPVTVLLPSGVTMSDLDITLPIVQNGSGTYFKQIFVETTQPNTSVYLKIDTGGNTIENQYVQGDFGEPEYGSYLQGDVKVKINSNFNNAGSGEDGNVVTFKTVDRDAIESIITYTTPGEYLLRYEVQNQNDIQNDQGGIISLSTGSFFGGNIGGGGNVGGVGSGGSAGNSTVILGNDTSSNTQL